MNGTMVNKYYLTTVSVFFNDNLPWVNPPPWENRSTEAIFRILVMGWISSRTLPSGLCNFKVLQRVATCWVLLIELGRMPWHNIVACYTKCLKSLNTHNNPTCCDTSQHGGQMRATCCSQQFSNMLCFKKYFDRLAGALLSQVFFTVCRFFLM